MRSKLVIGTRNSALALWQSEFVKAQLESHFPGVVVELKHIITKGDKTQSSNAAIPAIGGKGLFTAELEEALRALEIDLAVHSLKDLPTAEVPEFTLGAIPTRAAIEDAFISRSGKKLMELPAGAAVGTSSLRRASQILRARPDLRIEHIRGNVDSRLRKLRAEDGPYDAIVLAKAGLDRLGLHDQITECISFNYMLPAPGQGALAVQCRSNDAEVLEMLGRLHDPLTAAEVSAERAFLAALEAGCNTPVGALAKVERRGDRNVVVFRGRCLSPDGAKALEVAGEAVVERASELGREMADSIRAQGFDSLAHASHG